MPCFTRPLPAGARPGARRLHLPLLALAVLAALALGACEDDDNDLIALTLEPGSTSATRGDTVQFTAIGTYDDDTTADFTAGVFWSSSKPAIVSVNQAGLATALEAGQASVSATDAVTGVFDAASVTVFPPPDGTAATGGDTFTVTVDGLESRFVEQPAANPIGYDPWIQAEYDITTGFSVISVRYGYNSTIDFFDNAIEVVFPGTLPGSYAYPAGSAFVFYEAGGLRYQPDFTPPDDTSVNLAVDAFGTVGSSVTGTFDAVLCEESTVFAESAGTGGECGDPAAQLALTGGAFGTTRDEDLGTARKPRFFERDTGPQTHRLDVNLDGENHYVLYDLTPGTVYSLEVRRPDEDVTLIPYTDDTFSVAAVCDVVAATGNPGPVDEQCAITAASADLYFRVRRENPAPAGDIFYDLEAKTLPAGVELSVRITSIVDVPGASPDVIAFAVTNGGDTATASSFNVDFYEAPGTAPAPGDLSDALAVVSAPVPPAGGTVTGIISHPIVSTGSVAYATVDGSLAIAEADEGNNTSPGFQWGTSGTPYYVETFANALGCCTDTVLEVFARDGSGPLGGNDNGGRDPANGYSGLVLYGVPGEPIYLRATAVAGPAPRPYSIVVRDAGFGSGTSPGAPPNPDEGEPDDGPASARPLFVNGVLDRTLDPGGNEDWFVFDVPF